ncbi:ABC transporter ATP-binding protein [Thiospirochaeta perfilievii]|uniref:ABC transporter ATP-binding protein n=1 Tax=Thiospirochaeta perfilievii TaxID=252967 RepID=A0A5C1Q9Z0_9SPIO|nr:ABC transporter ATP-binding protein [Thiospirochaeta perfilievii]QEN04953.1 ABC transporter ATP-binding protein [Thiospirochaeta perfilievii]
MLKIDNIHTYYGHIHALKGISLEVQQGEIISLIGANGAGKSTTLLSISGLEQPRSGTITFDGKELNGMTPDKIVSLGITQAPEGRRIFPGLTVLENLELGAFLRNDKKQIKKDIEFMYTMFPILGERRNQLGGTLSGGEQQMLTISRALMMEPKLLLLDEPSLGLAPIIVAQIFEEIKRVNRDYNITVFLVEQNANQALKISDRGYVLQNGVITMTDTGENLLKNDEVRKAYLGA